MYFNKSLGHSLLPLRLLAAALLLPLGLGLAAAAAGGALFAAPEPPAQNGTAAPAASRQSDEIADEVADEVVGPDPVPDVDIGVCPTTDRIPVWPNRLYCQ